MRFCFPENSSCVKLLKHANKHHQNNQPGQCPWGCLVSCPVILSAPLLLWFLPMWITFISYLSHDMDKMGFAAQCWSLSNVTSLAARRGSSHHLITTVLRTEAQLTPVFKLCALCLPTIPSAARFTSFPFFHRSGFWAFIQLDHPTPLCSASC